MTMSQPLRRGVRAVSWTRVLPPRARQGQTRYLQIRAAAAEQPSSANGNNLPVVGTPSSAESAGMLFYFYNSRDGTRGACPAI